MPQYWTVTCLQPLCPPVFAQGHWGTLCSQRDTDSNADLRLKLAHEAPCLGCTKGRPNPWDTAHHLLPFPNESRAYCVVENRPICLTFAMSLPSKAGLHPGHPHFLGEESQPTECPGHSERPGRLLVPWSDLSAPFLLLPQKGWFLSTLCLLNFPKVWCHPSRRHCRLASLPAGAGSRAPVKGRSKRSSSPRLHPRSIPSPVCWHWAASPVQPQLHVQSPLHLPHTTGLCLHGLLPSQCLCLACRAAPALWVPLVTRHLGRPP